MSETKQGVLAILAIVAIVGFSLLPVVVFTDREGDRKREVERNDSGYQAGKIGQPPTACPYHGGSGQKTWMEGWLRGDAERRKESDGIR